MIKIHIDNKKNKNFEFKPNPAGPTQFQIIFDHVGEVIIHDDMWIFHRFVKQDTHILKPSLEKRFFNFEVDYSNNTSVLASRRFRFDFSKYDFQGNV